MLRVRSLPRTELIDRAASALASGRVIGWFQGREEWGPRALGNRSILAHPGLPEMRDRLNSRIKHRESFRPFAPSVRFEELNSCFVSARETPTMQVVYPVRPEWQGRLGATTHVDGTARVQTVRPEGNALFYELISKFHERTGIPALLNTSFNENEPIVHTPDQALDCFERTQMDGLSIGSFWIEKEENRSMGC